MTVRCRTCGSDVTPPRAPSKKALIAQLQKLKDRQATLEAALGACLTEQERLKEELRKLPKQ